MPRRLDTTMWERLTSVGQDEPSMAERHRLMQALREAAPDELDKVCLNEVLSLRKGLRKAKHHIQTLQAIHEKLTATPWMPATFIRALPGHEKAMVALSSGTRVVSFAEGIKQDDFEIGAEVFLNSELNLLLSKAPWQMPPVGETATFDSYTDDGRLALRSRDELFVVEGTQALRNAKLEHGDTVRCDKSIHIAYEKLELNSTNRYLLDETPTVSPQEIGGQRAQLKTLLSTLTANLVAPDLANQYRLTGRRSIMMVGPPGCGKTKMARVAAAEISRTIGKRCQFSVVKPSEWESCYVGETQRNIRECFASLREAAQSDGYVVLFLDEVECIARVRGAAMGHHSDKFLSAFLAEVDGFTERGNVAIICATNRKDLIAPEAYERLAEVEINVPRPDLNAAREIFAVHLSESLPFSPNGNLSAATRQEIIDVAVSRLFDPNADNDLCVVTFRDGKQRRVATREVLSGRIIEQICRGAQQAAFSREVTLGERGIQNVDMVAAVSDAIARLSTTLTQSNVHSYLSDLPQDMDVVSVAAIERLNGRRHNYLNSH